MQVTEEVYYPLRNCYEFVCRGPVPVKGKGTMTTYKLLGKKAANMSPCVPPNYQNVMLPGIAMYQIPTGQMGQLGQRGSFADATLPRHMGTTSFFLPPPQEDENTNLYAMPRKYNSSYTPHASTLTHATPPGSMGHRRKFSGGQPPISYSDAMIGAKTGQLVSKMSSHSLQNAPVGMGEHRSVESPELPAIHYRKLYVKGAGSGSLNRQPVEDDEILDGEMNHYPAAAILTQSQINGRRPETEGEYSGRSSDEDDNIDEESESLAFSAPNNDRWKHSFGGGPSSTTCSPTTPSSMSPTQSTHTPLSDSIGVNLSQTSSLRTTPNTPPSPMKNIPQSPSHTHQPTVYLQRNPHGDTSSFLRDPHVIHASPGLGMPGTALTQIRENPMFACESTTEDESNSPPCLAGDEIYAVPRGDVQNGDYIPPSKKDWVQLNDIMTALGHPDQVISVSPFPTSSGASTPSSWRGPHFPPNMRHTGGYGRQRNVPITVPRGSHNNSMESGGSSSPPLMCDANLFNGYSIEDYMLPNTDDCSDKSTPLLAPRGGNMRHQDALSQGAKTSDSTPPITNRPFPEGGVLQKQHSLPDYSDSDLQMGKVAVDRYGTMPTSYSHHGGITHRQLSNGSAHSNHVPHRARDSVSSSKSSSSGSSSARSGPPSTRYSNGSPPPLPTPPISEHSLDNDSRRSSGSNLIGPLSVSEPVQREAVRQCLMNGEHDQNGAIHDHFSDEDDQDRQQLRPSESSAFSAVVPVVNGRPRDQRNKSLDDGWNPSICSENSQNGTTSQNGSSGDDRASGDTDSSHRKSGKGRVDAPPFQVKRRQKHNAPKRLCRSLDYIPSDLDDAMSNVSSRAESPLIPPLNQRQSTLNNHHQNNHPQQAQGSLMPPFPSLGHRPVNGVPFSPIALARRMIQADNISLSSVCSSEMSRSDPALNYDSAGSSAAYESEYDNYRPGMASDEDYFAPEPISDMDIDAFDDINVDSVTVSDSYGMDMPFAMKQQKKITDV